MVGTYQAGRLHRLYGERPHLIAAAIHAIASNCEGCDFGTAWAVRLFQKGQLGLDTFNVDSKLSMRVI